jgi:hypothetical protein
MDAGPWNWLEVAKLWASLLIPAALAGFGVYIHRVTKKFEHLQWRSQKLIEKRLTVYDDLAPLLNDLLCYFTYVGCWRDLDPPDVVALKRVVDKKIYLAAPMFSEEFFAACMEFQSLCFETYTGWGRDASLRTHFERRREGRIEDWRSEWENCFSMNAIEPSRIRIAHQRVMEAFSKDIGVHASFIIPPSGGVPLNVR